jgi:hypothetical protein
MKLFLTLVILNVLLAMAVAGFIRVHRVDGNVTITIQTVALWAWVQAVWGAARELMWSAYGRRSSGSDPVTSRTRRPCLDPRRN